MSPNDKARIEKMKEEYRVCPLPITLTIDSWMSLIAYAHAASLYLGDSKLQKQAAELDHLLEQKVMDGVTDMALKDFQKGVREDLEKL